MTREEELSVFLQEYIMVSLVVGSSWYRRVTERGSLTPDAVQQVDSSSIKCSTVIVVYNSTIVCDRIVQIIVVYFYQGR